MLITSAGSDARRIDEKSGRDEEQKDTVCVNSDGFYLIDALNTMCDGCIVCDVRSLRESERKI